MEVIIESTHIAIFAISPNVSELMFYVSWWSNSFTSKCKKYKITEHQILKSDTLANQFRFSFRASCPPPPPPLPLLPSFIWISWEAICCMRPVPNHRNHVSIKCFPAWDAFITVSTIWIYKMYDDRGQARTLKFRRYFNAIVIKCFTPWLLAADYQKNDLTCNPAFLTTSDEFSHERLPRLREGFK